jgi:hypothetical protein
MLKSQMIPKILDLTIKLNRNATCCSKDEMSVRKLRAMYVYGTVRQCTDTHLTHKMQPKLNGPAEPLSGFAWLCLRWDRWICRAAQYVFIVCADITWSLAC